MAFDPVEKRDQGVDVTSVGECTYSDNVFYSDLNIVSRLELTVSHIVFLHVHKGGIYVCLGKTVSAVELT